MHYGMVIDLRICAGCGACVMACKQKNGVPGNMFWCTLINEETGTYPHARKCVLPKSCMHCVNPPCVRRCPTGASHKAEGGIVLIDREICIGCRSCLEACPYEVRCYVGEDPASHPYWGSEFGLTPYEEKVTLIKHDLGKVGKCDLCIDRLERGEQPLCVKTCITQCRVFGDLDDPESEICHFLRANPATTLLSEFGTFPSIYYIGDLDVFEKSATWYR